MGFWHSKEGRYRLYTDKERQEYGERKRREMSEAWHKKYISKFTLLSERGWTREAVDEFLGPSVDSGVPTVAYYRYRVERAEKSKRFKAFIEQQRAEKLDWETNYIPKSWLKDIHGWTESALKRFLPEPVRRGKLVRYHRDDVRKAEESEAYKAWRAKKTNEHDQTSERIASNSVLENPSFH